MTNAPEVKIQYLVNYDLVFSGQDDNLEGSELNPLSNLSNVNNENATLKGKKGFHLCGGSVDETTGEVAGCLLDGTFTLYGASEKAYNGIMGNELSNDNYEFDNEQYITIKSKNENTYIKDLIIYFDPIASEYATEMTFTNALKYDIESGSIIQDTQYNGNTIYKNKNLVYLHNFGEDSTLTQIRINFKKWSKKTALFKVLKIVTGFTGVYDKSSLIKFDFTLNKTNDTNQLRFGVTSNNCVVQVLDNDGTIKTLYEKDLIYKNVQVQISVDGIMQGVFYINEKNSEKGTDLWTFDCIDRLQVLRDIKRPMMSIAKRSVFDIVGYIFSGLGLGDIAWEKEAKEYCLSVSIEKSYFEANQTLYDLLLKCCQVGLLRIYVDRNNGIRITSGVN